MKYKIWNKTDNLITPIGEVLTPEEVIAKYPSAAIEGMKFIIADGAVGLAVWDEFTGIKNMYKDMGVPITDAMTDQEVLDAISYFQENPPIPEPTADERIAAAMEYDNLMKY